MKLTLEEFKKDHRVAIILETCREFRSRYPTYYGKAREYELDLDRLYEAYLRDKDDYLLYPENLLIEPFTTFKENFIEYTRLVGSGVLIFSEIFNIEIKRSKRSQKFC